MATSKSSSKQQTGEHSHPRDAAQAETRQRRGTKRSPGRPSGQPDQAVRQRLLDVATALVAREGSDKVSVRRIAQQAEVTPAMIHYYFGNRDGLLNALLEQAMQPVFNALSQWREQHQNSPAMPVETLIATATSVIAGNPWLPNLIVREVLGREGPFRERFIEKIAGRGKGLLVSSLESAQHDGQLRADADPQLSALSLISLVMFPFIALPISSRLYGVTLEPEFLDRLIHHNQQILLRGLSS